MDENGMDHHMDGEFGEEEEEEDEDTRQERIREEWNPLLVKSAFKGDLENVRKALEKGASYAYEDKKKCNALTWAACKGFLDITRYLLGIGAGQTYAINQLRDMNMSTGNSSMNRSSKLAEQAQSKPKVQLGVINQNAINTPLMWACSKGHYEIVWILLKEGLDWKEVDAFGNNCVHLSAASNDLKTIEALLEWGVTIFQKNARGHYVIDLTTKDEIHHLLKKFLRTERCAITNEEFGPEDIKYLCHFCRNFHSKTASKLFWMYEHQDDEERDRPEMRCDNCRKLVESTEKNLEEALKSQDQKTVEDTILELDNIPIKIDVKLFNRALSEQEKLRTQNKILDYLHNLEVVPNYKTILKSISVIQHMLEDAENRAVAIESFVKDKSLQEIDRLQSERNLRFMIDNVDMTECRRKDVDELTDVIKKAQAENVDASYMGEATAIKKKLGKNLKAQDILGDFTIYPPRDYPPSPTWDKKGKRWLSAIDGKPLDPKKPVILPLNPPKRKGRNKKKEPEFPDWALERKD